VGDNLDVPAQSDIGRAAKCFPKKVFRVGAGLGNGIGAVVDAELGEDMAGVHPVGSQAVAVEGALYTYRASQPVAWVS